MKDDRIVVAAQIPREVFNKLNALAKSQDRTLSYLIRRFVTEALSQVDENSPSPSISNRKGVDHEYHH